MTPFLMTTSVALPLSYTHRRPGHDDGTADDGGLVRPGLLLEARHHREVHIGHTHHTLALLQSREERMCGQKKSLGPSRMSPCLHPSSPPLPSPLPGGSLGVSAVAAAAAALPPPIILPAPPPVLPSFLRPYPHLEPPWGCLLLLLLHCLHHALLRVEHGV